MKLHSYQFGGIKFGKFYLKYQQINIREDKALDEQSLAKYAI